MGTYRVTHTVSYIVAADNEQEAKGFVRSTPWLTKEDSSHIVEKVGDEVPAPPLNFVAHKPKFKELTKEEMETLNATLTDEAFGAWLCGDPCRTLPSGFIGNGSLCYSPFAYYMASRIARLPLAFPIFLKGRFVSHDGKGYNLGRHFFVYSYGNKDNTSIPNMTNRMARFIDELLKLECDEYTFKQLHDIWKTTA